MRLGVVMSALGFSNGQVPVSYQVIKGTPFGKTVQPGDFYDVIRF